MSTSGAQDGGLTAPASRRKAGTEGSPLPRPFVAAKKPADKSAGSWSEWRESNSRPLEPHCASLENTMYDPILSGLSIVKFQMYYIVLFHFPTWVYSCCVRHEENRSESCRIVFPHMDVSRMGYEYCNIIYGQIRQKSLIFFVYL